MTKKTCQNYSLWCDHCQLFTVFWNQGETTFLWREKSLNNYILNQNHAFMTKQILNNYEMLGQNLERGAVKYSPLNK